MATRTARVARAVPKAATSCIITDTKENTLEQLNVAADSSTKKAHSESLDDLASTLTQLKLEDDSCESDNVDARVALAYRMIDRETSLLFGVDKDIDNLPEKRVRRVAKRSPMRGTEALRVRHNTDPRTVSLGYGEVTANGFNKVIEFLTKDAPEQLRITTDSSFIDIGSGYGKCVVQVALRVAGIKRSVGIEYSEMRHLKATQMLQTLKRLGTEWEQSLRNVEFIQGDATSFDYDDFSHIFAYDYIFSEDTHRALLPVIARTHFKTFACFCNERKLRSRGFDGDVKLTLLRKMPVGNTGKENHTVFIYARAAT